MKCIKSVSILLVFFLLAGCSSVNVCNELSEKAKDKKFVGDLEKWVDTRQSKGNLVSNKSEPSSDPPGDYLLEIDDELKGIVGDDIKASVIIGADDRPEAVFFFKGSFRGLVVFLPNKANTMVMEKHLKKVTPRTSLLCIERD